jgi:hypothetical protein
MLCRERGFDGPEVISGPEGLLLEADCLSLSFVLERFGFYDMTIKKKDNYYI